MLVNKNNASSVKIFIVETDDALRLEFHSKHTGIIHSVINFETDDPEKAHAHLASFAPSLEVIPQPVDEWTPRGGGFYDS